MPTTYAYRVRDREGRMLGGTLEAASEQAVVARLRQLGYASVSIEAEKGTSLSAAMAKHPKVFNRLYVSMVRAGEIGGFLDQVLVKVAETFETEVALRGKIRSAMTYPVVVFVMVLGIVGAMLLFIVPTFESLYESLGGVLPLPTRVLIGASNMLRRFFLLLVLAVGLLVFGFRRWKATQRGRYALDKFKLKVKVFGPLFHKSALSRFARTLSTLIRALYSGLRLQATSRQRAAATAWADHLMELAAASPTRPSG
jgi:type IV pilus assembly protein PilC